MKTTLKKNWKSNLAIVLGLTLAVVVLAPVTEAGGSRLKVKMNEPFVVDGQMYDPAMLTVREAGDYSPTSVFAEVWVGNECLGRLVATEAGVASDDDDTLTFARNQNGDLVLVGVNFRGEPARNFTPQVAVPYTALAQAPLSSDEPGVAVARKN